MIGSLVLTTGVVILFFQKIKRLHTTPIRDSGGSVEPRTLQVRWIYRRGHTHSSPMPPLPATRIYDYLGNLITNNRAFPNATSCRSSFHDNRGVNLFFCSIRRLRLAVCPRLLRTSWHFVWSTRRPSHIVIPQSAQPFLLLSEAC